MQEVILFILCFLLVLFIYEIFIVRREKKNNSFKKPMEVRYLVNRYKVDLDKANYKQMLQIISLTSSFDIALIVSFSNIFDSYAIQLLVALVSSIPVILISYHFVGNFYKKKGMIKDV